MSAKNLLIYQDDKGKEPFKEWLYSLKDLTTIARIESRLKRLRLGNLGDCRPVGNGVFEFRLHFGAGYRIYFGQDGTKIILLLCGGDKSTQSRDVRKAKIYWKDYQEQKR